MAPPRQPFGNIFPSSGGGSGGGPSPVAVSVDVTGKIYTTPGLAPKTLALLYANGAQVAGTTTDSNGLATWSLPTPLAAGLLVYAVGTVSTGNVQSPVIPIVPPPTTIALTATAVQSDALLGSLIARISSDADPAVTWSIAPSDASGGYASVSGARLRLEATPAAKSVTIRGTTNGGFKDFTVPLTVTDRSGMPPGLAFRFDTKDPSKLTVASGKVTQWVDQVAGYTVAAPASANAPLYDTTNTANGFPGLSCVGRGAAYAMRATADPVNDPLKAFINNAQAPYTFLVVAKPNSVPSAGSTGNFLSWGNTDTTKTGGAREYLAMNFLVSLPTLVIPNGNSGVGIQRGDAVNAFGGFSGYNAADTQSGATQLNTPNAFQVYGVRSNGRFFTASANKIDGQNAPTARDGAVTSNVFTLFSRSTTTASAFSPDATTYAILGWARELTQDEIARAVDLLAADFGITVPANPPLLDMSQFDLSWQEDFDGPLPYNADPTTDRTTPTGMLPYYLNGIQTFNGQIYGGASALGNEKAFYGDPRHPRIAPYRDRLFGMADGICTMRAIPIPSELSDLPMNNVNGARCSHLSAALITLGIPEANIQEGYVEYRVRQQKTQAGYFPALWDLSAAGRAPPEIDSHEAFGVLQADNVRQINLHSDPYAPDFNGYANDTTQAFCVTVPNRADAFALIGRQVRGDRIYYWHNRKLVGSSYAYNGVRSIAVTNGGTGVIADNGTQDGTIAIQCYITRYGYPYTPAKSGLTPNDPATPSARATLTVTAGVVTAAAVVKTGTNQDGNWFRITAQGGSTAIGGGVVLTTTNCDDPDLATEYNTPWYQLLGMQLGDFTGTPDPTAEFYMEVDYIRVYKPKVTAPTLLTGTQAESQAIFDRATAIGSSFSSAQQTRINDVVRKLKSTTGLRTDTKPMGYHTSDWDVTKLSLWDAIEQFGMFDAIVTDPLQASINWRLPGAATDFTLVGAPVFTAGQGFALTGTDGIQGPSIVGSNLLRTTDSHLAIQATGITLSSTLLPLIGSGSNFGLFSSNTLHSLRLMIGVNANNTWTNSLPLTDGYYIGCRGWRFAGNLWRDARLFHSGSFSSFTGTTAGTGNLVIGKGVPMTARKAHVGRRLFPAEVDAMKAILAAA